MPQNLAQSRLAKNQNLLFTVKSNSLDIVTGNISFTAAEKEGGREGGRAGEREGREGEREGRAGEHHK